MENNCYFEDLDIIIHENGDIYSKHSGELLANCGVPDAEIIASITEKLRNRYKDILRELDIYERKLQSNYLDKLKLKKIGEDVDRIASLMKSQSYIGDSKSIQQKITTLQERIEGHMSSYDKRCDNVIQEKEKLLKMLNELVAELETTENHSVRFFKNRYYGIVDTWKKLPHLKAKEDSELWSRFNSVGDKFIDSFDEKMVKENSKIETIQSHKKQIIENLEKLYQETKENTAKLPSNKESERIRSSLHNLDKEWASIGNELPRRLDQTLTHSYFNVKKQLYTQMKNINIKAPEPQLNRENVVVKKMQLIKRLEEMVNEDSSVQKQNIKEIENEWDSIGSHRSDNYDKRFLGLINKYHFNQQNKQVSSKYSSDLRSKLESELVKLKNKLDTISESENPKEAKYIKEQLDIKQSWFSIISR
jgi:hypothetical protein